MESDTGLRMQWAVQDFLRGAFWIIVAVMIASGVERYLRLEIGTGFMPFSPIVWWPLHSALRPFLYALLLLILVNHGKVLTKRALDYLRSP